MKKRILPALLALCMVMSLLPVAFAGEGDTPAACDKTTNCGAETHDAGCPKKCQATKASCAKTVVDGTSYCTDHTCEKAGCTKEKDHEDNHTLATCTNDARCNVSTTGTHESTCPNRACGFGGEGGTKCTLKFGHEQGQNGTKHNNAVCKGENSSGKCGATTHTGSCDMKCGCTDAAHGQNGCTGTKTGDSNDAKQGAYCASCLKNATCNPCSKKAEGCTLYEGHPGAHTGSGCTLDAQCKATTHKTTGAGEGTDPCPMKCTTEGCTLTKNHSGKHNSTTCLGENNTDTRCPGDENGVHVKGCVNFKLCPTCQIGMTEEQIEALTKCVGHTGNHENKICLGYNDDTHCGVAVDEHIAGCSKAKCSCQTAEGNLKHEGCTGKAGCPVCAALENCDCPVCKANPGLGVVTDENGEAVDPAEPTEPTEPTIPTKAEDFTDMEDWMAADVQTVLDKGWMQGEGETFNGRGVTKGATIAAVLARMDGETITGTDWDKDALAWAEGKDVFEGVELTGESMARKDLVLVIWRMADKPDSDFELTFTDVDGLEGDHLTAMKWAAENGIVKGNGDDTVTPDGSVTRAALCAMLARYDGLEK